MDRPDGREWRVRVKEFTDRPDEGVGAHVVAWVEDTRSRYGDGRYDPLRDGLDPSCDAFLKISDCYRSISYSLPMHTPADRANTLHQVEVLAATLVAVRDALRAEAELLGSLPVPEPDRSNTPPTWDDYG